MNKSHLWRLLSVATLTLVSVVIGITVTRAEETPSLQLTNSVNNWTVQSGSSLVLTAQVVPSYYHTIARMEFRQGNTVLGTCSNQNSCQLSLSSVANGTTYLQAVGYDVDGRVFSSPVMSLVGTANNNYNNYNSQAPTVTLYASQYDVDATSNSGMYIEARSTDSSQLRDLRIFRTDDWRVETISNCTNEQYNCVLRFYPSFNSNDAGKTYTYEAQSTDTNNNWSASSRIMIRVRTTNGNNGNQLPGVYLDQSTVPQNVNNNQTVNIRANAWDNEGLSNLTIYAYPRNTSGSSNHFEKYCGTLLHNIDCTLTISNFYGYEGQTFDVRAEAVDQAGQRVVSQYYTMTVNGNGGSNNGNNQMPGIYLDRNTIPETVNVNSAVHIRAEAWDNEALNRIEIYANPRNYYGYGYNNYNSSSPFYRKVCYTTGPNLTCTLDINNFQGYNFNNTTFDVWAKAYDAAGHEVTSNSYTMQVVGSDNSNNNQKPGIYLDPQTIPSQVSPSTQLHIKVDAWDNEGLSKIYLQILPRENFFPDGVAYGRNPITYKECFGTGHNLSCTFEITGLRGWPNTLAGVRATVVDAAGQVTASPVYNMTLLAVDTPTQTAPTVTVWTNNNVTSLQEDKSVVVYGEAKSPNGVWGVEVRALPSWSNEPIVRRCIMSNKTVTTGTCNVNIGPFRGHAGGTVKVWAIAWDTKTGMGGSSDAKYVTVTAMAKPNVVPTVSITPSTSSASASQTITWRAEANDENGISKIDIYVNARIVKTCTNVKTCEYTGGPYSSYARSSVSYAARTWDTTGKTSWTGYKYVSIGARTVSLRSAQTRR